MTASLTRCCDIRGPAVKYFFVGRFSLSFARDDDLLTSASTPTGTSEVIRSLEFFWLPP